MISWSFIFGFLAGVLAVLTAGLAQSSSKSSTRIRRWTKVESMEWRWKFDLAFSSVLNLRELATSLPEMMKRLVTRRPPPEDVTVDPGSYTIDLVVVARFTGREP